jgi:cell division septation protein DedD
MESQMNLKQRIVGSIIFVLIVIAIILSIFVFGTKKEEAPKPDADLLLTPAINTTTNANASTDTATTTADLEQSQKQILEPNSSVKTPVVVEPKTSSAREPAHVSQVSAANVPVTSQNLNTSETTPDIAVTPPLTQEPHEKNPGSKPRDVVNDVAMSKEIPSNFGQVHSKGRRHTNIISRVKAHDHAVAKKNTAGVKPVVNNIASKPHVAKANPALLEKKHVIINANKAHIAKQAVAIKPGLSLRVGVFALPKNAENLLMRLHAAHYDTYKTLQFSEKHGVLTQVYVGPFKTKEQAIVSQKEIEKNFNIKGISFVSGK